MLAIGFHFILPQAIWNFVVSFACRFPFLEFFAGVSAFGQGAIQCLSFVILGSSALMCRLIYKGNLNPKVGLPED